MSRLKVLLAVQGDGRGHFTQALAVQRMLLDAGHYVCGALVGQQGDDEVPAFFRRQLAAPITLHRTVEFYADGKGTGIDGRTTARRYFLNYPHYVRSTFTIQRAIDEHRPDMLVNFFESVVPLYSLLWRPRVPIVSIANQYLFAHPDFPFPPGSRGAAWGARAYCRMVSYGARRRLAISLRPHADFPSAWVTVPPPLRAEVLALPTCRPEPFWLVYLLKPGFRDQVLEWHKKRPNVSLHCFLDLPPGPDEVVVDDTLTFHRVDDRRFLDLLPRCSAVVATGGFTLIAEALYCGKPLFIVPMANHFEQRCNAHQVEQLGVGLAGEEFNLDRFLDFTQTRNFDAQWFRRWVAEGPRLILREIEAAVRRRRSEFTSAAF